ncbi:hypothetical protein PMAYCL1PPCAC_03509, partial [Pristionchus mayeri]
RNHGPTTHTGIHESKGRKRTERERERVREGLEVDADHTLFAVRRTGVLVLRREAFLGAELDLFAAAVLGGGS